MTFVYNVRQCDWKAAHWVKMHVIHGGDFSLILIIKIVIIITVS